MLTNITSPSILILTHKLGVGIAFIPEEYFFVNLKNTLQNLNMKAHLLNDLSSAKIDILKENYELIKFQGLSFLRVTDKTAENLSSAFDFILKLNSVSQKHIQTVIVGIGPGSFTGLRLGCAFVNGLKFGNSKINLLPVRTSLTEEFLKNESQHYITFSDILTTLYNVTEEKRDFVSSLVPEYGREPGPVLKLKKQ